MITQDDIARVKGLGCLRDKTTEDCFNVRVITRNGKITAAESRAIESSQKGQDLQPQTYPLTQSCP